MMKLRMPSRTPEQYAVFMVWRCGNKEEAIEQAENAVRRAESDDRWQSDLEYWRAVVLALRNS
jgi:hypothetical protein